MSREQERIRKRLEKNPIVECNKIQKKFCPELFSMFGEVADPRHQSYIKYSARTMLGTLYYKSIAGISSMQEMTRAFNDEKVCKNLYGFIGEDENEYLPHGVTENEFLERLNSEEYINKSDETVKQDCESKAFVRLAAKIKKKFPRLPIIIAADGLYVSQNVLQICKEYHWDYIIRYICITKNNAKKIVDAGRNRWKIENQGFNRQKHWQGNIEHACSLFHEGISALYHCG